MKGKSDPLDQIDINRQFADAGSCARVRVLDQCDSTNAVLGREAAGSANGLIVAAEVQTNGRGRRGRTWIAPPGGSLAFSMLWHFNRDAAALSGLSLAAGVSVVSALKKSGGLRLALKWPNDIWSAGAKLGGILTETRIGANGGDPITAIIGVGLNLKMNHDDHRAVAATGVAYPVTDLAAICEIVPGRNELLARIATELACDLACFDRDGFAAFQARWNGMHALQDKWVTVLAADGQASEAKVIGAANDGALIVEVAGERRHLHGGEVSLRPQAGAAPGRPADLSRIAGSRA